MKLGIQFGVVALAAFVAGTFVASPELRAYAVDTVFSSDIADGEVKNVDIATNAITTSKINDGAVKTADIGDGEVKFADIASDAIQSVKIADSGILAQDIASNAVTNSKIASFAVTNPKIGNFEVTNSKLSSNSVTSDKIADDTITEDDISPAFMKWVTLSDGQNGWTPNNSFNIFPISESAAKPTSMILVTVDDSNLTNRFVTCGVSDLSTGSFVLACAPYVPEDGAQLQYIVFNP